ncbi:DUF459 domain-containing protein [Clostridium fermenticellae]|uniref:DUF459 domain-containing protein n=1 Tax=Clostridium fermenticellae TaxID=2068654 RepID=A0A386H2U0_9CLOT|nr:GDSL-type esterase/lipase family protein [Clostridium fermenticellae]AYD39990.1 DUF459 domain-containing protein [Clostridium fermenticellae]
MNKKFKFVVLFLVVIIIGTGGLYFSLSKSHNSKIKEVYKNSYNILAMGDSLARGTGDETGKGFVNDFALLWKNKTNSSVSVDNIAVNGDTSSGLLNIVKRQETVQDIKQADIIFISIGGNEIKNFYFSAQSNELTLDNVKAIENKYFSNLEDIFKCIKNANSNCTVVFVGLYNPSEDKLTSSETNLLEFWNHMTDNFVSKYDVIFIPTYDLFKGNTNRYLSSDKFHPNSRGYDIISNRIFDVLKNHNIK